MELTDFIRHMPENGWLRLYHSPKDVRAPVSLVLETPNFIETTDALKPLHAEYVQDFEDWSPREIEWWRHVVTQNLAEDGDVRAAAMAAYERWPAGPASREDMVGLFRKYWFACLEACKDLPEVQRMPPEDFLMSNMSSEIDPIRHLVVTAMPYWPIGLDENGNWC